MKENYFLIFKIFISLIFSYQAHSMNGAMYSSWPTMIQEDECLYNKEQLVEIRKHNSRVIPQTIELTNDFWESCSKICSIFFCCYEEDITYWDIEYDRYRSNDPMQILNTNEEKYDFNFFQSFLGLNLNSTSAN